jgi:Zn-dependent oligopeptidase
VRDLQAKYDETLHNSRITTYQNLWGRLQVLAKYARSEPVTPSRLRKLSVDLREWYFDVGGLFLSDNSRDQYFALQDAIVAELKRNFADDKEVDDDSFETLRLAGSGLRDHLSSDLGSRKAPRV